MIRKSPALALSACVLLLLSGCISNVSSDVHPSVRLSDYQRFYVRRLPADERGIEQLIAANLSERGMEATSGDAEVPAAPVDAVVTYSDRDAGKDALGGGIGQAVLSEKAAAAFERKLGFMFDDDSVKQALR